MTDAIASWLTAAGFMPHGACYLWSPGLLWTMVLSDLVIVAAYYSIPASLIAVVRMRRELSFNWIVLMFGAFIFACGTTHLLSILTVWQPAYWLEAGVKIVTAAISIATAVALWPIVRRVSAHMDERDRAERELREVNTELHQSLFALERQRSDLERLNRMSGMLQVCNSTEEVARVVADAAVGITEAPAGAVYVIAADGALLEAAATWGDVPESDLVLRATECWAYRQGRPFPDGTSTLLTCNAPAACGTRHVCHPLTGGGETVGVIQLRDTDSADLRHDTLMDVLVDRAGLAVSNIRMREYLARQSTRDPLTQLFNRGYLEETLVMEERRAQRSQRGFCVAMLDLDGFKALNDAHGHDAGDEALVRFAEVLREHLRVSDVACRYGGEEFAVVLPGASLEEGVETVERVRAALETHTQRNGGAAFTVSAGVACFPLHGDTARAVRARADEALYAAKHAGRNRVLAAGG